MHRINLFILFCLLVVMGCGKEAAEKKIEKAIEKETGGRAEVDLDDEKVTIETKDGEFSMSAGKSAKLPEDFPSDVYVYKGAAVAMSMEVPKGKLITLITDDDLDKVMKKCGKELTSKGWSQKAKMDLGEQKTIMYQKNNRMVNVMAVKVDGSTHIRLTVSEK